MISFFGLLLTLISITLAVIVFGFLREVTQSIAVILVASVTAFFAPFFLITAMSNGWFSSDKALWQKEFHEPLTTTIHLSDTKIAVSGDFYGRAFWFKSDADTIAIFATEHGFLLESTGPDDGWPRRDEDWGWTSVAFSSACTQVELYKAPKYFGNDRGNVREAQLRYCPNTGEAEIIIVALD